MNAVSRTSDLTISAIVDELVIHDTVNNTWHNLNAATAAVFRAADGSRNDAELAAVTGQTADQVATALAGLAAADLVTLPGISRRSLVTRGALVGGVAAAGLLSMQAPASAASASTPGGGNGSPNQTNHPVGNALIARDGTPGHGEVNGADGQTQSWTVDQTALPAGTVTAFTYYASNGATLYFLILDGNNQVLFASDTFSVSGMGPGSYTLPTYFSAPAGWHLGFGWTSNAGVPYTVNSGSPTVQQSSGGQNEPAVNAMLSGTTYPRTYSIGARITN